MPVCVAGGWGVVVLLLVRAGGGWCAVPHFASWCAGVVFFLVRVSCGATCTAPLGLLAACVRVCALSRPMPIPRCAPCVRPRTSEPPPTPPTLHSSCVHFVWCVLCCVGGAGGGGTPPSGLTHPPTATNALALCQHTHTCEHQCERSLMRVHRIRCVHFVLAANRSEIDRAHAVVCACLSGLWLLTQLSICIDRGVVACATQCRTHWIHVRRHCERTASDRCVMGGAHPAVCGVLMVTAKGGVCQKL